MPSVASSAVLGTQFNQEMMKKPGAKVFFTPSELIQRWHYDRIINVKVNKSFWIGLAERLVSNGITPVVFNGINSRDISELSEKCIYVRDNDIGKVMAAMRATGCVLDIFSGISRLAIAARTPYVYVDERTRYLGQKEIEIEGLCCEKNLPREFIYSFPGVLEEGDEEVWQANIYDMVIAKLLEFLPTLNRDEWPSPVESNEIVLYENVKKNKMKKLGIKFIKVNRDMRRSDDGE